MNIHSTLILIDLQEEFFNENGILGQKKISKSVAERCVALADKFLKQNKPVFVIQSCYDKVRISSK